MDDVAEFISTHCTTTEEEDAIKEKKGCNQLHSFINYISERETENFRSRRRDNENSVTLTTIHQVFFIHSSSSQFVINWC
jgi:hypothetical protein